MMKWYPSKKFFNDEQWAESADSVVYLIDDVAVSKEEYEDQQNVYSSGNKITIGRKYSLDDPTINSILLSSSTRTGTIITENDALNVRQSPSTESAKIGTVAKGSTVVIFSEIDGWYEIEYGNGSGYVLGDYIQIID